MISSWSKSQHQVCERNVAVPTMFVVRIRPETDESDGHITVETGSMPPLGKDEHRVVAIQWFGEAENVDLEGRQFYFTLTKGPGDICWRGRPENFQVIFLGPVSLWPNQDAVADMAAQMTDDNREGLVVWVASPHYQAWHSSGWGPASFALPFRILLADPVVGVIQPRFFSDMTVMDRVNKEFEHQHGRG